LRFPISGFKLQESCTFKISDFPVVFLTSFDRSCPAPYNNQTLQGS
jgi:hypothetical protein